MTNIRNSLLREEIKKLKNKESNMEKMVDMYINKFKKNPNHQIDILYMLKKIKGESVRGEVIYKCTNCGIPVEWKSQGKIHSIYFYQCGEDNDNKLATWCCNECEEDYNKNIKTNP